MVDEMEGNEKYDKFVEEVILPGASTRKLSRSPQSDEGIESDPDRAKLVLSNVCWNLDTGVRNEEDPHALGQRLRVTRCYSTDSAVVSDDDQVIKGWENSTSTDTNECESDGKPRFWRTPSVVVSDYSDYSYLDEKYERNDPDSEEKDDPSSQASSCSCLDCDEMQEFNDLLQSFDHQLLQVCRRRRHSDTCCMCFASGNASSRNIDGNSSRRNSCLTSSNPYYDKLENQLGKYATGGGADAREKNTTELLDIPAVRKISDCSTNSSLSGDDYEITELQPVLPTRSSGWRKLRNIVHWTPFFQTYKKQRYPWVQLAGHQGNFRAGPTPGTILKKLCPQEEACFRLLMNDVLRPYVPEFKGVLEVKEVADDVAGSHGTDENDHKREDGVGVGVGDEGDSETNKRTVVSSYLQLQDLLGGFEQPSVMDCKVGVRTYLETELAKAKERPKLRKDMYEKMVQVDPSAPSVEERRVQGVTKPRYMVWRETISSTATLGFRVEGIKLSHGGSFKDFKTTRTREQVTEALKRFVEGYPHAIPKYLQRLKAIRTTLKASTFFSGHEVVGSSLLFVHDARDAGVWMIDFAKTLPLPQHLPRIRHDAEWQVGNHEDGYLIGINNLIDIFEDIRTAGGA